tara:strand:+ start:1456 stop:1680 length:225 start_codon:yes stop_codon:yes gene_type:complete
MQYTSDLQLADFNFWSGAKQHKFTYAELGELDDCMSDLYQTKIPTETDINDLFWFELEFLCECIGLDFEQYENR